MPVATSACTECTSPSMLPPCMAAGARSLTGVLHPSVGAPDVPLDVALPVLVAAPGVHGPPAVQRQAVPAAGRHLHHPRAAQRRDPPRLALVAPVGQGNRSPIRHQGACSDTIRSSACVRAARSAQLPCVAGNSRLPLASRNIWVKLVRMLKGITRDHLHSAKHPAQVKPSKGGHLGTCASGPGWRARSSPRTAPGRRCRSPACCGSRTPDQAPVARTLTTCAALPYVFAPLANCAHGMQHATAAALCGRGGAS